MPWWSHVPARTVARTMTAALLSLLLVVSGGGGAAAVLDGAAEEIAISTELTACDDRAPDALIPESRAAGVPHRCTTRRGTPSVSAPAPPRPGTPLPFPAPPRPEGARNAVLRC
ncbi:hypothetical protein I5Q34_30400 [Streptomyces sp. AV19]|uniref:hypothetical protein n=1 Tax=Streptomyces sp. AV19 TaxID=2793068 RepID=UPI0018FEE2CE|nr:hypothetical protein [Streptomyces sp. AV19]MBH1938520.1 hypothetical protein [Streptomyces sp. AV19]MDG4535169.1 hypothetical protein [Streptomyces sp. AV19]